MRRTPADRSVCDGFFCSVAWVFGSWWFSVAECFLQFARSLASTRRKSAQRFLTAFARMQQPMELPPVGPELHAVLQQQLALVQTSYGRQAAAWSPEREDVVRVTIAYFYQFAVLSHFTPIARMRHTLPNTRHLRPEICWARIVDAARCRLLADYQCPCQGCYYPTGSWCDSCDDRHQAMCTERQAADVVCRSCRN